MGEEKSEPSVDKVLVKELRMQKRGVKLSDGRILGRSNLEGKANGQYRVKY